MIRIKYSGGSQKFLLVHFFLTVGQNNFQNKIPVLRKTTTTNKQTRITLRSENLE
jgi:hypothetical protein